MTGKCLNQLNGNKGVLMLSFLLIILGSCMKEDLLSHNINRSSYSSTYKTKNVFIIVADGLRFSESWGDSTCQHIPALANILSKEGVVNANFYNLGDTYTTAGHTNLTTGVYQTMDNLGMEYPLNPSVFQYWNQAANHSKYKSWVIASKDKLAILGDCTNSAWQGKYTPSVNTGIDGLGLGSGFRDDSLTLIATTNILNTYHPNIVLVNFIDIDLGGHSGNWNNYTRGIRRTDKNISLLWQFIQNDRIYRNSTAVFITSDHGRHLDSVDVGFVAHGDGCEGCRHVSFLAIGPDFKKGITISNQREQIDIPVTIAELLGFQMPGCKGKIMTELFSNQRTN